MNKTRKKDLKESVDKRVEVDCPTCAGQTYNNLCIAYDTQSGRELARCRQGETLTFTLNKPTKVEIVVQGYIGKPIRVMKPTDRYRVGYRCFCKIYLQSLNEK